MLLASAAHHVESGSKRNPLPESRLALNRRKTCGHARSSDTMVAANPSPQARMREGKVWAKLECRNGIMPPHPGSIMPLGCCSCMCACRLPVHTCSNDGRTEDHAGSAWVRPEWLLTPAAVVRWSSGHRVLLPSQSPQWSSQSWQHQAGLAGCHIQRGSDLAFAVPVDFRTYHFKVLKLSRGICKNKSCNI